MASAAGQERQSLPRIGHDRQRTARVPPRPTLWRLCLLGHSVPRAAHAEGRRSRARFRARYAEHASLRRLDVLGATPTQAYRVRAKLVFGGDGALGLYARDSHDVVDIPECRVLAPALQRVSAAARLTLSGVAPLLDGLDLRLVDAGVLVTLIAPQGTAIPDLERLAAKARRRRPRCALGCGQLSRGTRGHAARHRSRAAARC